MTMTYLTLNVLEFVEGHVKVRRCTLFKNIFVWPLDIDSSVDVT